MSERRIVQISAVGHDNTPSTQSSVTVFALDDRGSVWMTRPYCGDPGWTWLPRLPHNVALGDDPIQGETR